MERMMLPSYGIGLGVTFGVLSCAAYTVAAVAQRRLAVHLAEPLTGRRQIGLLLRHPLWWASLVFNGGRAGFQVEAVSASPRSRSCSLSGCWFWSSESPGRPGWAAGG